LGDARLQRLGATMSALGLDLEPPPTLLAEYVERMAAHCLNGGLPLPMWDLLYDDIACMFEGQAAVLSGRRLLLTDDRQLRACSGPRAADTERRRQTPFFPPVRQRIEDEEEVDPDVDLTPPRDVQSKIFYVHAGLTWYDENREQTRARKFFQTNKLVQRFDARSLLDHLRSILANSQSKRLHRDSLRFVFNLRRTSTPNRVNLADLGLRVPNASGKWIPAQTALFSHGWRETRGEDLALLATAPDEIAPELAALAARMLAPPTELRRATETLGSWVEFLRQIGVQDGLPVLSTVDNRKLDGRRVSRAELVKASGLPADVAAEWTPTLSSDSRARFPETEYVAKSPVYWLPGQTTVHTLPNRIRTAYARLVTAGLTSWHDEHFTTVWERDRHGDKNPRVIPTPLAAFLSTAEWLPVHDPDERHDRFARASDAWYFPLRDKDGPPHFTPLISSILRNAIDDDPRVLRRLKAAGVGLWTDTEHAPRLIAFLGELLAAGKVNSAHLTHFQRTYRTAWGHSANGQWPGPEELRHLVVELGGRAQAITIEDLPNRPPLVVADNSDEPFALRLIREFEQPLLLLDSNAGSVSLMLAERFDERIARLADTTSNVFIGNEVFTATSDAPKLLEEVPWLRTAFAMVLDHRWPNSTPLSERVFQEAIDRLQHVRLVRANQISVRMGGTDRPLPARMRGILPIPDEQNPTLGLQGFASTPNWELLEALPEALLHLVGHRALGSELELAIHKLRALRVDVHDGPTLADLAEVCGVDLDDAERTVLRIDTALAPLLQRLYPVVCLWVGVEAAQPFSPQAGTITSDEDLAAALAELADSIPVAADQLIEAAREASSLDDLRRILRIPLSDLNAALTQMRPPQDPIDYGEEHAQDFAFHVRSTWGHLSDRLRWSKLAAFRAKEPIERWTQIRDPNSFTADPIWGHLVDCLSADQLKSRTDHELEALLGDAAPQSGPSLPAMTVTHQANVRLVESLYRSIAQVVRAWCDKHTAHVDTVWEDATDPRQVLQLVDQAGALDFEPLDQQQTLGWLQALGAWPAEMPMTDDPAELGLTDQDLERAESEEHRAKLERQRARQMVTLNGESVDVADNYLNLLEKLDASLEKRPGIVTTAARFTKLEELDAASRATGGDRTERTEKTPARPRSSQAQLSAIGFAGEWVAYQWLANRHGAQFTDDCWVSTNRAVVLTGSVGDDGRGYDFLVPSRGGAFMYEVKATTGDPGEFQLGESEVRVAQANARNDRWRLLIITHALNDDRRLLMLRNPFSPTSRGQYVFAGEGLRLRYRPFA